MKYRSRLPIVVVSCAVVVCAGSLFAKGQESVNRKGRDRPQRARVQDGSPVHNVGQLWLHTGNWGAFGSRPGGGFPYSHAPSGEWPAGSGIEYLYVGGLWVGALKGGVPAVSTAAYESEFRPTQSPLDTVYYGHRGAPGGNRFPWADPDDDKDGIADEDKLDGYDNDLDGSIDEDYAAISNQMQSRWYTDDQPEAIQDYPQHNPLHIEVHEESYQWSHPDYDDFVGFRYTITNIGTDVLEDIHVGFFIDGDVGNRDSLNYWDDDLVGFVTVPMVCTPDGAVSFDYAYVYDADGDNGTADGYFGVVMLGHMTDPTGELAPARVGIRTFARFSGNTPFEEGGDPTNDFERYELLSSETIERNASIPRDYRMLASTGPFWELRPGSTLTVVMALVATPKSSAARSARGPASLLTNTVQAARAYKGDWYDVDQDPLTGIKGRETPVPGPIDIVVDSCQLNIPINWPHREPIWINNDCAYEELVMLRCGYTEADSLLFRTGVAGRETWIPWIVTGNPFDPVLINAFDARAVGATVLLKWDVYADETIEGFKIYRSGSGAMAEITTALIPPVGRSYTDRAVMPGYSYKYVLAAVKPDGSEITSAPTTVTVSAVSLELRQNYPNPFNPETAIAFVLPEKRRVTLSVYTAEGKLVRTLLDGIADGGVTEVPWDGRDANGRTLSSGVYFYQLRTGKRTFAKKMILLK
jgi:hypothetical protein